MQLATFLDKYDNILFDLDGVITSEQNYWTITALTVWEWIYDGDKISIDYMSENAIAIREMVMCSDRMIGLLKNKGVNSNWDLAYILFAMSKILDTDDFEKIYKACEDLDDNILNEYPVIAERLSDILGCDCKRNGKLWTDLVMTFQEWFLGDDLFRQTYNIQPRRTGYKGLINSEKPIINNKILTDIFKKLSESGKRLATATGRPSREMIKPLNDFGIMEYFAVDAIINYDHIQNAEEKFGITLSKPHPYIFVKAMLGEEYDDSVIISGNYDKSRINKTLVVGDAGSDMLAAKAMGADFCAVLTGVSGKAARGYFEAAESEYILDSLENFLV